MACKTKLMRFLFLLRRFSLPVATTLVLGIAPTAQSQEESRPVNLSPSHLSDDLASEMPGGLISVGTHAMHLYCTGKGLPTVVLEAGLGGLSLEWQTVQSALTKQTRVCTYDRAGYGWSEKSPRQRTSEHIVTELNLLLTNARVPGPYVLVGHSFGGYTAQLFASRYPDLTAGVVLVDASHSGQVERFREVGLNTVPVKPVTHVRYNVPKLPANLPEELHMTTFTLIVEGDTLPAVAAEFVDFYTSAQQVAAELAIPDVPVMVLTRGQSGWQRNPRSRVYEQLWQTLQAELADLSPTSAHLWASKSGHHVHLDQPVLTSNAIMMVVERARIDHQRELTPIELVSTGSPMQEDLLNWVAFNDADWKRNQIRKRMFSWPVAVSERMYSAVDH